MKGSVGKAQGEINVDEWDQKGFDSLQYDCQEEG